jgi:hypothetical protein
LRHNLEIVWKKRDIFFLVFFTQVRYITHGLRTIGSDPIIANVMRLTNALDHNSSADACAHFVEPRAEHARSSKSHQIARAALISFPNPVCWCCDRLITAAGTEVRRRAD